MLSAVVLTKNEENNIVDCLESLLWCDEIVIIDDYSQDRTLEIVRKVRQVHKVYKVFRRHLNNNFSSQRNFGLEKAKGDWMLFVDADERVGAELAKEIKQKIRHSGKRERLQNHFQCERFWTSQNDVINGYYVKRSDLFLGRWLKHGEANNVQLLRLAKKGAGKWNGKVHEEWQIKGERGFLLQPLLHYSHPTISEFLKKINTYSTIRASELFAKKVKSGFWPVILYPKVKFLQNYFVRLGFLDGMPGLIMALMMSFHSFLARGKLYLWWHQHESS